jgi:hypothetical protein
MVKSKENLIAAYAFLAGIILAVILGLTAEALTGAKTIFYTILVILGLLIGFLNAGDKNATTFLLASLALVIVGGQGNSTLVFISEFSPVLGALKEIVRALLVLFIPATIIAALKVVFSMTKV